MSEINSGSFQYWRKWNIFSSTIYIFPNYEQSIHYAFWIKKWKGKIFQTWLNRHFFFTRLHKYLIDQSYGYNVDHEIFKSYISVILQEF